MRVSVNAIRTPTDLRGDRSAGSEICDTKFRFANLFAPAAGTTGRCVYPVPISKQKPAGITLRLADDESILSLRAFANMLEIFQEGLYRSSDSAREIEDGHRTTSKDLDNGLASGLRHGCIVFSRLVGGKLRTIRLDLKVSQQPIMTLGSY